MSSSPTCWSDPDFDVVDEEVLGSESFSFAGAGPSMKWMYTYGATTATRNTRIGIPMK